MDWQGLWQLLRPYFAGRIRHLLAALAGALVAKHIIQPEQQSAFVDIGFSMVVYLIAEFWSVMAAKVVPGLQSANANLQRRLAEWENGWLQSKKPPAPSLTSAAVQAAIQEKAAIAVTRQAVEAAKAEALTTGAAKQ